MTQYWFFDPVVDFAHQHSNAMLVLLRCRDIPGDFRCADNLPGILRTGDKGSRPPALPNIAHSKSKIRHSTRGWLNVTRLAGISQM
ncbi:hypothetical protein LB526_09920 [Mesorhizobium sp. CA6]|uniref:hypothetical protein n=1 Tax=Mesorhizobium sp. CA6 TaxID=588500 RepID=UPI001CCC0EB5|nr:hypothetical protein [Mesorhizobium sp. CA6]MBZ9767074.1 hypothetical protein [Mesorhizobium sp. CA6]